MSEAPVLEATRRRLTERQAEVVQQLIDATAAEVDQDGYAGLTVRNVARRAGVAPATAYNYFSSKDHLLAELLWRRMSALPTVDVTVDGSMAERLTQTVQMMMDLTTGSPDLVGACTTALLNATPDVKHLRDRIGAVIHQRFVAALGPGVDPTVVRVLETTYSGALLMAGMGHMTYAEVPAFLAETARLMTGGGTHP
ncbi:MAG TPA: helix-turn-helix domain-containing protein [Acidimicrobiales bacterium]|jgi:AcrR family transcriptional regulator|nr:helix-turn-helix domain-containing protein [Acidimicrobiales bacterium]